LRLGERRILGSGLILVGNILDPEDAVLERRILEPIAEWTVCGYQFAILGCCYGNIEGIINRLPITECDLQCRGNDVFARNNGDGVSEECPETLVRFNR